MMMEAVLDNKYFNAPVPAIVKRKTEKAVDFKSKREDRCRKFVEANYSTGTWSALSNDRPLTDKFFTMTNKKAIFEISD